MFHAQPQGRPAGYQDTQTRTTRQQVRNARRCLQEVFEIVKDEQELSGLQEGANLLSHWRVHLLAQMQTLPNHL